MMLEKDLIFSEEEFRGRVTAVQKELEAENADALLVHQTHNVFYLSGYQTTGTPNYQFLLVPRSGDPTLLCRGLESRLADYYSWVSDVVIWEDTDDPISETKRVLEDRGLGAAKIGYEGTSNWLTSRNLKRIEESLPEVTWRDLGGTVEKGRLVKSPTEIEYIRQAAKITEAGMAKSLEAAREGNSENDVAAAAAAGMISAGSEPFTTSPIITSGPRSAVAHTSFRRRKMETGDTLLVEISGVFNRYTGPLMRSAVIGPPPDRMQKMWDALNEGLEAAIAAIRPGVTSGEVDEACTGILRKKDLYEYYKKRLGYSVGIGFAPGWGEGAIMDLKQNDDRVIEAGMVFHLPPALRVDEKWGFGLSETLTVTDTGCEVITNFSRDLVVG